MDAEEGRWLLCALRNATHVHLGFANFSQYVEHLLGYRPRSTEQKLRVAEALEELPGTRRALEAGELNWSVVRELTRVARPETEQIWLEAARNRSARQVEDLVSGKLPGDLPDSTSNDDLRRHALHFEVSGETLALFREAIAKLRRSSDEPLDEETALMMMARHVLGGPTDAGRASYQVSMTVCQHCGKGWQQGSGELVEVAPEIVEMGRCDQQDIGPVASAHVGGEPAKEGKTRRATQDIPPSVRREVMHRDGGRCCVPGCRNATWVDLHHIKPRSEGGEHSADNLICLCGAHHRAAHRGQLVIVGLVSTGLTFLRSDGTPYGQALAKLPDSSDFRDNIGRSLCGMGFSQADVRRVLAKIRFGNTADAEEKTRVLREALALLTEGPS